MVLLAWGEVHCARTTMEVGGGGSQVMEMTMLQWMQGKTELVKTSGKRRGCSWTK